MFYRCPIQEPFPLRCELSCVPVVHLVMCFAGKTNEVPWLKFVLRIFVTREDMVNCVRLYCFAVSL